MLPGATRRLVWPVVCALSTIPTYGLTVVPVVSKHLSSNALTLKDEDTLQSTARLLKRFHVTGAPVADGSSLSGILSRNDLLVAIDKTIPSDVSESDFDQKITTLQQRGVWEVMASKPTTIPPDATLLTAAREMHEKKLNRLMVKSDYSSMLGIISSTDVVFALLKCDADAAAEIDPNDFTYNCAVDEESDDGAADLCSVETTVEAYMASCLYVMRPSMTLKDAARAPRASIQAHQPRSPRPYPAARSRTRTCQSHTCTCPCPCTCTCTRVHACESHASSVRLSVGLPGLLRAADVTGAPVVGEDDELIGVISRNDLLKALLTIPTDLDSADAFGKSIEQLEGMLVSDVMSKASICISPKATMLEAAKMLAREKLNRLMVVDPVSGALCGVLSSTDVVFAMLGCGVGVGGGDDDQVEESRTGNLYRKGIY